MKHHVVTFNYTLRDIAGRVLDTSAGVDPITYLEGAGQVIDGLDEQLRGVAAGTKTTIQVLAAKAYGERDESQVRTLDRDKVPVEGELNPGDQFKTDTDVYAPIVTVVAVEDDKVTLDANHPLAGMDLTFEVEVLTVRVATAEEIKHGHSHGADGAEHCD